jgi:uncharacterized membrane protein YvbJ
MVENMSYCPKCGNKIDEDMVFCPKCGASLKGGQTSAVTTRPREYRHEKEEKREKHEKGEKAEKHEKREHLFIGWVIGGLIMILIGLAAYLEITPGVNREMMRAWLFIAVGVMIIVGAIYGATMAARRHPKT